MRYTDDSAQWWELEHEFASRMTEHNRAGNEVITPVESEFLEEYYVWVLEYARGLEQKDFIKLVQTYAPSLMQMVEVTDEN